MAKNLDIVALGLPERIRKLRLERRLSQTDLADEAGLTWRTVHDLETGRRERVQEQTLILLARGLDITYEELVNGLQGSVEVTADVRPQLPRRQWLWVASLMVIAAMGGSAWLRSTEGARAQVLIQGSAVTVRDGLFHAELWRSEADATLSTCIRAPWSDRILLLGRHGDAFDSQGLEARDLASGNLLWSFTPDITPAVAAFGPDVFSAGRMGCAWTGPVDLDGNGEPELLAKFGHSLYYPTCIVRFDPSGRVLNTYWSKGSINVILTLDTDADGKEEVYLGGTNNSPLYQGATVIVLDENHFHGVADDVPAGGSEAPGDGSLLRVIYPHFPEPIMDALAVARIRITDMESQASDVHGLRFITRVGEETNVCLLTMDPQLRVHDVRVSDMLTALCTRLDSVPWNAEAGQTAWVRPWLKTRIRIAEGRADTSPDPVLDLDGI
jgi:transcriptional regulator with XRE-family HTH domain